MFDAYLSSDPVIAFHCSGASGRQWQCLGSRLDPAATIISPDLIGYGANAPVSAHSTVSLADEAAPAITLIDSIGSKVHLVGHSYGGAVALRVALERPNAVASLTLYEPSAFGLLRHLGGEAKDAYAGIAMVAESMRQLVVGGRSSQAMRLFVDYWHADGAWDALSAEVRRDLEARAAKVPCDFAAIFCDPMELRHFRKLNVPALMMVGENSRTPSRVVVRHLARVLPRGRAIEIAGAGHMGPISHREAIAGIMARHIANCISATGAIPRLAA